LPWKTRSGAGREYCADSFDARAIGSHSVCGVCPPLCAGVSGGINAARLSERLEGFRGLVRPALARQPASSGLDGGGLYLGMRRSRRPEGRELSAALTATNSRPNTLSGISLSVGAFHKSRFEELSRFRQWSQESRAVSQKNTLAAASVTAFRARFCEQIQRKRHRHVRTGW